MGTVTIKTTNLEYNGKKLRIFDKIGFNSGQNWVINAFAGCFVEVDPEPISEKIIGVINEDIKAGNLANCDHITMSSTNLLCLYLEGGLPLRSIINVVDCESFVVFKDVPFTTSNGPMNFNLFVSDSYKIATIDVNGNIV